MTIYYLVPVPSSQTTVSGGTRKLFDHVALLRANGIDAQILHHLPPARIESGPENLFIFPEVYGEHLVDALPPGVPRISMVQNGYLLDYDQMAKPKDPHPFLRCPDLVAVMVESEHTADIVRQRFPDLHCPIIRFTSSGNGRDGRSSGLHVGSWPRQKLITYFEYKRQELNRQVFANLDLPNGWAVRPMANMTDEQIASTLRSASIFAAPLTHEGLCATTQEAMIAGAVIVCWPGGPSVHVPTGWPTSSTPTELTAGNITVGGPMEYLARRAEIAPQDDLNALRRLVVDTARAIDADPKSWGARAIEASRWHCEEAYSRQGEIDELVSIMRNLDDRYAIAGTGRGAREVAAFDPRTRAASFVELGRCSEAADTLLTALASGSSSAELINDLALALRSSGRSLTEIVTAVPGRSTTALLGAVSKAEPGVADRVLEALFEAAPSLAILAAAAEVALDLDATRRLVWSARLRERGLQDACPAVRAATNDALPLLDRALGAAAAHTSFADPRAGRAFLASALSLDDNARGELATSLAALAPELAGLLEGLASSPVESSSAPAAPARRVLVISRHAAAIRTRALAAVLAEAGHQVVVLQPSPRSFVTPRLEQLGVVVHTFEERTDWQKDCIGAVLRYRTALLDSCVIVPAEGAKRFVAMIRRALPNSNVVVDVEHGPLVEAGQELTISSDAVAGTTSVIASAANLFPSRRVPKQARNGVCVLGDTRGRPSTETDGMAAALTELQALAPGTPIVVIGDDPTHCLDAPGALRVEGAGDPTPWIASAKLALTLFEGQEHWLEAAALSATPAFVVPRQDADAKALVTEVVRQLGPDDLEGHAQPSPAGDDRPDPLSLLPLGNEARNPKGTLRLLVDAEELLEDDRLLSSYGASFTASDDVALVAYRSGMDVAEFETKVAEVAERCSFDLERGPNIQAFLPPSSDEAAERAIAEGVSARLSTRRGTGPFASLETLGPDNFAALSSFADHHTRRASAPLVSVLMPIYRHGEYLEQAVRSVLEQTCTDFELLLVDDRSPDDAGEIAEKLSELDARIRYVENGTNLGLVGNHRRCLELANGDYIKFLHADDLLAPDALERLAATAIAHPEASFVSSTRNVIDALGATQRPVNWTEPLYETDAILDKMAVGNFLLVNGLNRVGEPSTVLFRRSAITPSEFSAFAGRTYTSLLDISTWCTLLLRGPLAWIAEPLSSVRLHPTQYGRELGPVVEHLEWLELITEAHRASFLDGPGQFAHALGTMAARLVAAYAQQPVGPSDEIANAVTRALRNLEPMPATAGAAL